MTSLLPLPDEGHRAPRIAALALPLLLTLAGLPACHAQTNSAPAARPAGRVRLGVEVLLSDSLQLIRGKRVGLITNQSGTLLDGRSTVDVLFHTPGVRLTALFAPEHGLRGMAAAGEKIASGVDSATGVPVYSLYGNVLAPTPDMLKDVDVLVYDIQDVGARVYTYEWTMALSAAAAAGRKVIVLDRPDPVRGDRVEGGVLDTAYRSFVGQFPVALRYGLTAGELLEFLVGEKYISADVTVVPMKGWQRSMWWEETGLSWKSPSPNIRSTDAALLYSGTVYFEGTNLSEGRGTTYPFQLIGAGWLNDAGAIAKLLNAKRIPGVVFDSSIVAVEAGQKWGGKQIPMIAVVVSDRNAVRPQQVGLELLRTIYSRHPHEFEWNVSQIDRLAGSDRLRKAVETEGGIERLLPILEAESKEFEARAKKYWIYR